MLGNQGALGATFVLCRAAQAASMIAVIGMTSNFISEMVTAGVGPTSVLVGTLSIVSKTCLHAMHFTTNITSPDLPCCAVLRHHSHSLPRQPPSLPDQQHHRHTLSDRVDRRRIGRRQATLLPELQCHWET